MDTRHTLKKNEAFLQVLEDAQQAGSKVNLLLDDAGITRAEGIIISLDTNTPAPFIELNNGLKIALKSIVAVNGVFLPEYSEC